MRAFSTALLCVAFLGSSIGATRAASPDFHFLPARIGETVTFTYEVHGNGMSTREFVTLARTATNRLTATITPEGGAPVAFFAPLGDDGLLEPVEQAPEPPPALATSTPLPRYPRYPHNSRGSNDERRAGEPSPAPRIASFTPQLPPQIAQIASMVVVASGPGSDSRTWTFANVPGMPPVKSTLTRTNVGSSTVLVADGAGYGTALHLECVFRDGKFIGARGTERAVAYGVDASQEPTTSFTLAAFGAPAQSR